MGICRRPVSHRTFTLLLGSLGLASLLLAGCYDVAFPTCQDLPAEGIESLRVESDRGPVEVVGVEGAETIELGGAIHVTASSERAAERRAEEIELLLEAQGSEAVLRLWIPPPAGVAWGDLQLQVPARLAGRIETYDGAIHLSGLRADQDASTTNGAVEVDDVVGDLTLWTTNGALRLSAVEGEVRGTTTNGAIEAEEVHGDLTLATTSGRIDLLGGSGTADLETTNGQVAVADFAGDVVVVTTNGRIDLQGVEGDAAATGSNGAIEVEEHAGSLDLWTTNGKIEMQVAVPEGGSVLAHTTNGPIDLAVPPETSGSLMATTVNGDIEIEGLAFSGDIDHDQAIGTLGCGGTVEIVLATTNGTIDLDAEEFSAGPEDGDEPPAEDGGLDDDGGTA